jgi:hypothetical protein
MAKWRTPTTPRCPGFSVVTTDGVAALRYSLVRNAITAEDGLLDQLVNEPTVTNVYRGKHASHYCAPHIPHGGFLADSLMRNNGFIDGGVWHTPDMFRMTVEDVFVIQRRGTVATGRIESGTLRVGDTVQIDGTLDARVDGIEAFRKTIDEATAGDNVGVLFRGVDKGQVNRGSVLTAAGFIV